jgi:hypothetical protein
MLVHCHEYTGSLDFKTMQVHTHIKPHMMRTYAIRTRRAIRRAFLAISLQMLCGCGRQHESVHVCKRPDGHSAHAADTASQQDNRDFSSHNHSTSCHMYSECQLHRMCEMKTSHMCFYPSPVGLASTASSAVMHQPPPLLCVPGLCAWQGCTCRLVQAEYLLTPPHDPMNTFLRAACNQT